MRSSIRLGVRRQMGLLPSVVLFGIILGFTAALGGLSFLLFWSTGFIIFAGAAQFIVILLLIANEPLLSIAVAGIIINLRHMLYGVTLSEHLSWTGWRRMILAYLLTDEAFLATMMVHGEVAAAPGSNKKEIVLDLNWFLIGAGGILWIVWNISTAAGFLLHGLVGQLLAISADFVVAATFLGYLITQWQRRADQRSFILMIGAVAFGLSFLFSSSTLLILIMSAGVILALGLQFRSAGEDREGSSDE